MPTPPSFTESVYQQVHALARARLGSGPAHSLSATVVVNEAYVRLHPYLTDGAVVRSRGEFLALAAKALRSVVVDHARQRNAAKRDPGLPATTTVDEVVQLGLSHVDLVVLHDLLEELRRLNPRMHDVVEMKMFGGCDVPEIARSLGVSERTVKNDWRAARAWLANRLSPDGP